MVVLSEDDLKARQNLDQDTELTINKKLTVKKPSAISNFLLRNYNNQELLYTLYRIATDKRYLINKNVRAELIALDILDSNGQMSNAVKHEVLNSIIVQDDKSVILEIGS